VSAMTEQSNRMPRPFIVYATVVFVSGVFAFLASWIAFPPTIDLRLVLIVAGAVFSELFPFAFPIYTMSLAYPLSMSAAVLGGPASACIVSLATAVNLQDIRDRRPISLLMFNSGQLLVSTAAGAWAYYAVAGRVLVDSSGLYTPLGVADFPRALFAMIATALLSYAVNTLLMSTGLWLGGRSSFRAAFESLFALVPTQFALAFVGFLMAQVLAIAAVTLPLFIFPLEIGRQFYQRYLGLRNAYRDTIKSLVGALETKDPYTRGHSVRVAVYATQIGEAMGLDEGSLERLEYAALLHDLGKLALSNEILTKPSSLTDDEMDAMRGHPAAGAAMVERIPPLKGLAPYVLRHHERYSGGGYPHGDDAEHIPMFSRVLSVADAFDAMTTDRAYRRALSHDEAMAELVAGAGTQFDPEVVSAFTKARASALTGEVRPKSESLMSADVVTARQ